MSLYRMDELEVDLPPGLIDRSTHLLEWPVDGDSVTLTFQRDQNPKRLTPSAMQEAAIAEYGKRFPHYVPETAPVVELGLHHAISAFRWKRESRVLYQIQAFIELGDRLMIVTATGLAHSRRAIEELFSDFARTLELRER